MSYSSSKLEWKASGPTGILVILSRINSIRLIWLDHVVQSRVGIIRVKQSRGKNGFILKLEIFLVIMHFTTNTNKAKK